MKSNRFFLLLLIITLLLSCKKEKDIKTIYNESIDKGKEGKYLDALIILEQGVKKQQRDYWYYLYHGFYTSMLRWREYDKALEDYKKAFEIRPDSEEYTITYFLGTTYYDLGDYENAIKYLEKNVEMYNGEQDLNPFNALSESYYNKGDYNNALIAINKYLEIDPEDWGYMQKGLILSHMNRDIISLKKYYDKAMALNSSNYLYAIDYTKRLIEMGEDKRAYDESIKWIEKEENNGWAYANLGYLKMLAGDWDAAYTLLDEAFEKYGHKPGHDQLIALYRSFYFFYTGKFKIAYSLYLYHKYKTLYFSRPDINYPEDYIEALEDNILFQRLFKKHGNPYE